VHHVAGEDEVVSCAVQIAAGLAAKDRGTSVAHKRLLYADAVKACGT
jgi:hypothetical protein